MSRDEATKSGRRVKRGKRLTSDPGSASKGGVDGAAPQELSQNELYDVALRYLDKRDASVEQMRRVLLRKLGGPLKITERSSSTVTLVLDRLMSARLLDDERFALGYASGQRRRGVSTLGLRQKMRARGLSQEHVAAAIDATMQDEDLDELASARRYAEKRKLTQRYDLSDPTQRNKALAALGRRGFSYEIACKTLGL